MDIEMTFYEHYHEVSQQQQPGTEYPAKAVWESVAINVLCAVIQKMHIFFVSGFGSDWGHICGYVQGTPRTVSMYCAT